MSKPHDVVEPSAAFPPDSFVKQSTAEALPEQALNYTIVAQSSREVQEFGNAPAISMAVHLFASEQRELLNQISVYSERGQSREQVRLLYMNAVALRVWMEMGKTPTLIGSQHRPPQTALLALGVPFSD